MTFCVAMSNGSVSQQCSAAGSALIMTYLQYDLINKQKMSKYVDTF